MISRSADLVCITLWRSTWKCHQIYNFQSSIDDQQTHRVTSRALLYFLLKQAQSLYFKCLLLSKMFSPGMSTQRYLVAWIGNILPKVIDHHAPEHNNSFSVITYIEKDLKYKLKGNNQLRYQLMATGQMYQFRLIDHL